MKISNFKKAFIGVIIAAIASVAIIIGVVFAGPTQSPNDALYVAPTFGGLTVPSITSQNQDLNIYTSTPAGKILMTATRIAVLYVVNGISAAEASLEDELHLKLLDDVDVSGNVKIATGKKLDTEKIVNGVNDSAAVTIDDKLITNGDIKIATGKKLDTEKIVNGTLADANPLTIDDKMTVNGILSTLLGVNVGGVLTAQSLTTVANLTVGTVLNVAGNINMDGTSQIQNPSGTNPVRIGDDLLVTGNMSTALNKSISTGTIATASIANGTLADANPLVVNDNLDVKGTITGGISSANYLGATNLCSVPNSTTTLTDCNASCPTAAYYPISCGFSTNTTSSIAVSPNELSVDATISPGRCRGRIRNVSGSTQDVYVQVWCLKK